MDIVYREEGETLRVVFSGPWTVSGLTEQADPVLKECRARGSIRLLLDLSLLEPRTLSTIDRFHLGMSLSGFAGVVSKIATLVPPEFLDPEKFALMVARNRGVTIEVFTDERIATQWLQEPVPRS